MNITESKYNFDKTSNYESKQLILRPVLPRDHWPRSVPDGADVTRIAVLDLETTGIDPRRHAAIEIAVAILAVDGGGEIVAIERGGSALINPGFAVSNEIEKLTGITNEMLNGKGIDTAKITEFLDVDLLVSFNAGFDRPHLENLLPHLPAMPWACAMVDINWRSLGFEPGPQGYLLAQCGYYNASIHRAMSDVQSLITLLNHTHSDGETITSKLLSAARAPAYRFEARNAYFGKHHLIERRYRWSGKNKVWHKYVLHENFRAEYRWYLKAIGKRPAITLLPPQARHLPEWKWRAAR